MPRVVAFDLMDTVVRDPYREALEAATGLPPAELFSRRDPDAYPALERGDLPEAGYWATYAAAGIPVDVDAFHMARRAGYRWLPGMRPLLEDLDGHTRRVVASNYPTWIDEVAATFLAGVFDDVHASCHLGARKPDEAFYLRLLDALDVEAGEVAFVDDREANVVAAERLGIRVHRFAGADPLRAWLRGQGLPV
ncbi:MAG: HAD-IA family hydrolase [Actinobacteria bacterium]|nr:HAD-IA family hydrolase [Actinomycetota bacterium]